MVSFADKLPDIATICRTNDVKRLDLFGSRLGQMQDPGATPISSSNSTIRFGPAYSIASWHCTALWSLCWVAGST